MNTFHVSMNTLGRHFSTLLLGLLAASHSSAEDRGSYVYGTPSGCLVKLQKQLKTDESLKWDGKCVNEYAEGDGTVSIIDGTGKVANTIQGKMSRGVLAVERPVDIAKIPAPRQAEAAPVVPASSPVIGVNVPNPNSSSSNPLASAVVQFDLGSAKLSDMAKQELARIAKDLKSPNLVTKRILVVGHADSSGTPTAITDVAMARAQAVSNQLASNGVRKNRMQVVGRANQQLAKAEEPLSAENRRVTFEIQ